MCSSDLKTVDWNVVLTLLEKCQLRTLESPFRATGFDANTVVGYLSAVRSDESLDAAQRQKILQRFVKLNQTTVSAVAQLLLLNDPDVTQPGIMPSLLLFQRATYQSGEDRKSTRLNSSHKPTSYAGFCLNKKKHPHIIFTLLIHSSITRTY